MEFLLWAIIIILSIIVLVLLIKLFLLQKAAREIEKGFTDKLTTDTNTLIDVSTRDKYMRRMANTINVQLRKLRSERHRFQQGDMELKNAIINISHDLRTPLTAICGYLDFIEQEDKSEAVERYIAVIRNRTDMLKQLTEELFRYSVLMSNESRLVKEPVIVNHVLEESIAAFYTALSARKINPCIQISKIKVIRNLDRSALSRVFSNLLSNAIKYSDGDLEITLSETGEITFTNIASGLSEVQVGRLFDRFYTVEAARKSTGLGLAIAKNLIEQMNGTITAELKNNRLRICIYFPDIHG